MQYGVNVFPYKRVSDRKNKEEEKKRLHGNMITKGITILLIVFLISRVNIINTIAPFGVAVLLTLLMDSEDLKFLFPCIGSILGYLSIHKGIEGIGRYLIAIAVLVSVSYFLKNLKRTKKVMLCTGLLFVEFVMYKVFITQSGLGAAFLSSCLEIACIVPLYFITNCSIICIKNRKTRHLFNSEELISMAIVVSLVIAGTYGMTIYKVSVTNILALTFVLILSYVSGSPMGAAVGTALGSVIGMGFSNLTLYTSIYALCGLITGAFKEVGRWFSALACLITFLILSIYSKNINSIKLIEPIVACIIFLALPVKFYHKLSLEINREEKEKHIDGQYIDKIKNMFLNRVDNFSSVLNNISKTLIDLSQNEKLGMKNKSTSLVECLADRVCRNCTMKNMCWKREMHYTYSAFEEILQNYQNGINVLPKEIGRKCLNKDELIKNAETIVKDYMVNAILNKRIAEGKSVLSEQINNIALTLREIIDEFGYNVKFNLGLEKDIIRVLNKEGIKYSDITCFVDESDRNIIKLRAESCGGREVCVKKILPLIDEVTGKNMCLEEEGCNIDPITKECEVTFRETPKYHIASFVKRKCKDGEEYNGDSYSFEKSSDGKYLMLISDGMGSGPEAGLESSCVVDLIEKFISFGFKRDTAINAVNSVMSLKFYEEEKFSTLDMANIDLYSGEMEFVKVGAAASFVKKGDKVEDIKSNTLPIGILDKVDAEVRNYKLENGDIIVMLSDGVVDYSNENVGKNDWVINYLKNCNCNNPKEIAEQLIENSLELSGGKVRDDMTVMVSKVYNLY
ncbi:stage II sporulation protein E [Haloimpatiens sp. FM7315]|uniref:stage II sporulation protein E n=1 Tax=Haloimpatiens sp. FM7315 TaxID=3298609 RepID=UPI00370BAB02